MKFSLMVATLFAFVLSACGGGGSSGSSTSNQPTIATASDTEIIADVKSSNIDFLPIIYPVNRPAGTWRWPSTPNQHVLVYIPVPTSGNRSIN